MKSVWRSLGIQGYEQTCFGSSIMTLVVDILVCIVWLVPKTVLVEKTAADIKQYYK